MASAVWTGAIGDLDSDVSNWVRGVVPDGADTVIVGTSVPPPRIKPAVSSQSTSAVAPVQDGGARCNYVARPSTGRALLRSSFKSQTPWTAVAARLTAMDLGRRTDLSLIASGFTSVNCRAATDR